MNGAQKYFGKYRGVVTDNSDKKNLGRIRAQVPELLGSVKIGWALPSAPLSGDDSGFFAVPAQGAGVWIEFEAGDLSRPIYTGAWWASGKQPNSATPDQKVLKTKAGHTVTLDDTSGSEKIEITDKNGSKITMSSSGLELAKGSYSLKLDSSAVSVNGQSLQVT